MNNYLLRRLLQLIPTLFGISVISFILLRLIPGDACQVNYSQFAPTAVIERCRSEHGLDLPILQQYMSFLGSLFSGSSIAGRSIVYGRPAVSVLLERLPATLLLAVYGSVLALLLALPIGLGSAQRPGSALDRALHGTTATVLTLPAFLVGMLLILLFSLKLHLFPTSGFGKGFLSHLRHLFLPALTLAIANGAMLARVLRRSLIQAMNSPHVLTAHAKGLSHQRVFIHHIVRNGLISPLTLFGLQIAWLLSGTVVVEKVFALPGIGSLLVQSVLDRDYAVVQIATICFAVMVTTVMLLIDMIYPLLDPRVRHE